MTAFDHVPNLPASHYFITVARGAACRTVTVRTLTARLCLAGLALLGCWTVASSLYLGIHDDLVAALMQKEARAQYVYEDRIATLRADIDRESSRNLVGRSALEDQVRDLTRKADTLQSRATLVDQVVGHFGARPGAREAAARTVDDRPSAISAPAAAPPTWGDKPHPEAQVDPEAGPRRADADDAPVRTRLSALTLRLDEVEASQVRAVADAGSAARRRSAAVRTALSEAGLAPERFAAAAPAAADVGGPFVPLDESFSASAFGQALLASQADVSAADRLAATLPHLPFAKPLAGTPEVTSPFGPRLDPFLGRPALHPGVDLREPEGAEVRATAAGRVTNAGPLGGYGLMVEVDHGNGLATRYAHLSAVLVATGERVTEGQIVGHVGQTGRATGPHLHYETRIDGEPVDPMRFLQAGERLAAAEGRPSPE